jgi:hypothetical protein
MMEILASPNLGFQLLILQAGQGPANQNPSMKIIRRIALMQP